MKKELPTYKDKERGTWYASFYYTDWQGRRRLKKKRGFLRQKDAKAFEEEFLRTKARSCDMAFGSMVEIYFDDMKGRLKANTLKNKRYLVDAKILPFFRELPLNEITPAHVRKWQSDLLAEGLAPTYIKTINNQISAIFNYAVRYYGLQVNPARLAGGVGKKNADEMNFWTVEQFTAVHEKVRKLPARTGLSVLFWTGLRIGELLALRRGTWTWTPGRCPSRSPSRASTARRSSRSRRRQRAAGWFRCPRSWRQSCGSTWQRSTTSDRMTGCSNSRSITSAGRC